MSLTTAITAAALLAAQTPPAGACRIIEPTAAQRAQHFANAYAVGPFAMRTQTGVNSCEFRRPGVGSCRLSDPGMVHVTMNGAHVWYEVPTGRSARIDVGRGVATCRVISAG